jgi:hypothetical protein
MKVFELTLPGFDGTSDTDGCVKWIKAPGLIVVADFLGKHGVVGELQGIDPPDELGLKEGIDLILDEDGDVVDEAVGGAVSTWRESANIISAKLPEKKEPSKRDKFIRLLASYLVENQAEMSIKLRLGRPEAHTWAAMRGLSPLFGYQTVDEAEPLLREFLNKVE